MKKIFTLLMSLIIMSVVLIACNNVDNVNEENQYEENVKTENSLNVENNDKSNEPIDKEIPNQQEKIVTIDEAKFIINEFFEENFELTLISEEAEKQGNKSYCFLIDYSSILDAEIPIYAYAYVDCINGELSFEEAGYGELNPNKLYSNIPSEIFPIPEIDGNPIIYDYFSPPTAYQIGTWYTYPNNSDMEQYKAQLADAGFDDLGQVQSVNSLWTYESEDDNTSYIVEIYENSICLYINKF